MCQSCEVPRGPIHLDHKEQREKCVASIKRNLGHLKWKLRKVDLDVKQTLTCVLTRCILVYTGNPYGRHGSLEEGGHLPPGGAAVQGGQRPAQCHQ